MPGLLKNRLHRILDKAASRLAPVASHCPIEDPRAAAYLDPEKHSGVMSVHVEQGLAFNAFTIGAGSFHPWYLAAQAFANDAEQRARLILEQYYARVRPASVSDWHDLGPNECLGLRLIPTYGWSILPWVAKDPGEIIGRVEATQFLENRTHGLEAGMEAGAKAFGPVTEGKLRVEIQRLAGLTRSISAHGFRYDAPSHTLGGCFLVAGDRWRWLPTEGMHRVPVGAALGVREFKVRVASVVRREESSIWPHVRSGLFTEKAALVLFDRLLDGRPPHCVADWIEWVKVQNLHGA